MAEPGSHVVWVPWSEEEGFEVAAERALQWTEREMRVSGREGLLVTPNKSQMQPDRLVAFGKRHAWASRKSRGRPSATTVGLIYLPDHVLLSPYAKADAVVAVEHPSDALAGWAAYRGAIDLRTGNPASLEPGTRKLIDDLAFQGYNAYAKELDRRLAAAILDELDPGLSQQFILMATLTAGISPSGWTTLAKVIKRTRPTGDR